MLHTVARRAGLAVIQLQPSRKMITTSVPKNPLILILGATGTGKSKLAVQLAQTLAQWSLSNQGTGLTGAEVVNADAMQLYRGLPIITNKMTAAEQQGIPHHLLDHISLDKEPWTVQEYVREASLAIEDIRAKRKIPIVVGGTGYYIHGLLFKNAVIEEDESNNQRLAIGGDAAKCDKDAVQRWPILGASNEEMYRALQEVDPVQASKWHPNDRRKIQRSLEIYLRSGRRASDIYAEQRREKHYSAPDNDGSEQDETSPDTKPSNQLRYDPIIFWLEAEDAALKKRLNQRVDDMVENGLLVEAKQMYDFLYRLIDNGGPPDKTKGIWVSIGYKELEPWIEASRKQEISEKQLKTLEYSCLEAVKAGTRQYAKRQNRYIRIRLGNALTQANAVQRLFLLDSTDLDEWQRNVQEPASNIMRAYLDGESLPHPSDLSSLAQGTFANIINNKRESDRAARRCESCNKILMTEQAWSAHINGRAHKKILQSIRKRDNQVSMLTIAPP